MSDLVPGSLIKEKSDCGCGCGLYGTPKNPNRAGIRCVRGCTCNACRGKNNRRKGDRKALAARKALGIPGVNSRHEEVWGGSLRIEAKAGAQVGPILTRYMAAKHQSEASRAIGDNRPFVMAAMPDKGPGLIVMEIEELAQVMAAVAETWGLIA
jgi:hypothetical protein